MAGVGLLPLIVVTLLWAGALRRRIPSLGGVTRGIAAGSVAMAALGLHSVYRLVTVYGEVQGIAPDARASALSTSVQGAAIGTLVAYAGQVTLLVVVIVLWYRGRARVR